MEEAETQQRVEGPFIFPYNKRPGRIAMKKKKEKKEKKTKRDREKRKRKGKKGDNLLNLFCQELEMMISGFD